MLHWAAMRKIYPSQIKIYFIEIVNETVYLIQIKVYLMASCLPTVADGASVVLS